MPKSEEERIQTVIDRDLTVIGRMTNATIDFGRTMVGKSSIWDDVREADAKRESERQINLMDKADHKSDYDFAQQQQDDLFNAMCDDRASNSQFAEIHDPRTERDYLIVAEPIGDGMAYQIEEMRTGMLLQYGIVPNGTAADVLGFGKEWVQENVLAVSAQEHPELPGLGR